ncbi:MAG: tripartite tricarboxylate transporter substrate binding protein [Alphaproteobacteria bacterium]|nr:tripartite tricarboxylate transporter substrate binding protein [Alphaproteobacteria bacterium]
MLRTALAALGAVLISLGAAAQPFPSRPVTIVVPFPPGGSVDGVARILAAELTERAPSPFVVENRAGGAGGAVGAATVLRSRADGYTLLLNASIHVVTPLINRNVTFDVINGFTHVSLVADGPLMVTTHPSVPASNLREFFDLVRREPDKFNFATTGFGSAGHLALEFLKRQAGVPNEIAAYRGAGPALNDLVAGTIHILADPMLSSLPLVRGGRLKPLAVTSLARSPLAPEVPTVAESGMQAFEMLSWYAVWGPPDMDAEATATLARLIGAVTQSARFKERLAALGFSARSTTPEGLRRFVEAEVAKYREIVQAANIRVE